MKAPTGGHKAVILFQTEDSFPLLCSSPLATRLLFKILSWATKCILSLFLPEFCMNVCVLSLHLRLSTYISFLIVFQLQHSP